LVGHGALVLAERPRFYWPIARTSSARQRSFDAHKPHSPQLKVDLALQYGMPHTMLRCGAVEIKPREKEESVHATDHDLPQHSRSAAEVR
jgi:hypothetical protein